LAKLGEAFASSIEFASYWNSALAMEQILMGTVNLKEVRGKFYSCNANSYINECDDLEGLTSKLSLHGGHIDITGTWITHVALRSKHWQCFRYLAAKFISVLVRVYGPILEGVESDDKLK